MFHEILFNEIYFIGSTQYEVSMKIMNKPYQIRPEFQCSDEVKDLLPRMIEKDKTKRITAAQVLEHPLFNAVKVSPKFLKIMREEKLYMDKYFSSQDNVQPADMIESNPDPSQSDQTQLQPQFPPLFSESFNGLDINKESRQQIEVILL